MKIVIIIINYNGEFFLKKYLNFFKNISKNKNIELIVSDDQSTDLSIEILKKNDCKITINKGNKGFAANVNNGIKFAKSLKEFDYYIIANNDIILNLGFENILHKILNYIEVKFFNVGLIGFKEINEFKFIKSVESSYSLTEIYETNNIPGFLFAINKSVINDIGYFDEEYFMYGEDNDYFFRVQKNGYKIINSNFPVYHFSEGSSSKSTANSFLAFRNSLLFAQKNLGFLKFTRTLLSLIWIVYKPINFNRSPSVLRLRRSGFLKNNILLFKSLIWNYKYFIKNR